VIIFFLNGINSQIGWSGVLSALDYFSARFEEYNVSSFMPVPIFVGYMVVGVVYHMLSNRFTYSSMITVGNLVMIGALALTLLVSLWLEQTLLGFVCLLLCSFVMGIGSNLAQLSYMAMFNYLSQDVVSKYTVGTAVSGLVITGIRALITLIYGAAN
jgi:small-conductance mechanosensitive channel